MSMGTEPTPPQLRFRQDTHGWMNKDSAVSQLREQGAPGQDVVTFLNTVRELQRESKGAGQVEVLNAAAAAIGAEVHWV